MSEYQISTREISTPYNDVGSTKGEFMKNKERIEKEIDSLLDTMDWTEPYSESYAEMAKNLETLMRAKNEDKSPISGDKILETIGRVTETGLKVGGSLLMLAAVLKYDETDIIPKQALGFIQKIHI